MSSGYIDVIKGWIAADKNLDWSGTKYFLTYDTFINELITYRLNNLILMTRYVYNHWPSEQMRQRNQLRLFKELLRRYVDCIISTSLIGCP